MKWLCIVLLALLTLESFGETEDIFRDGFELSPRSFSSSRSQKPSEFRPTIHHLYGHGGRPESVSGVPVPKKATGYFFTDGSTVPTYVFPGMSVHEPSNGPLPPHLSVADPYDRPPQYPLRQYSGLQDFSSFHGSRIHVSASLQGATIDAKQLTTAVARLLDGKDISDFRVDEQNRLIYQNWYVSIGFNYEMDGFLHPFAGGASNNLYAMLGAQINEVIVNRRMSVFQAVIGHVRDAKVPNGFARSSLLYPYSLSSYLPESCRQAGYGLQYNADGSLALSQQIGNEIQFLAKLSIRNNHKVGADCYAGALMLESDEWTPYDGLKQALREPDSNLNRNAERNYSGTGARYLIKDKTLLIARKPPLGERFGETVAVQTVAGQPAFKVGISHVGYHGEFDFSGKFIKRPLKWPKGNCSDQNVFALQYQDEDSVVLTQVENGVEVKLGVMALPKLLHCEGNSIRALTTSLGDVPADRISLDAEASDVRPGKAGRYETESSGLFQFTAGKFVLAKSSPKKKIFDDLQFTADGKFIARYGAIKDHYAEFSGDGRLFVERPATALGKACETSTYGLIFGGDGKTVLSVKSEGKEIPIARFASNAVPICSNDIISIVADGIEPTAALKPSLKPGESDIAWANVRNPGTTRNWFVFQGAELTLARKPPAGNAYKEAKFQTSSRNTPILIAVFDKPAAYESQFEPLGRNLTLRISGGKYAECEKMGVGFRYYNERLIGLSKLGAEGEVDSGKIIDLSDISCRVGSFAFIASGYIPPTKAMTQKDYPDTNAEALLYVGTATGVVSTRSPITEAQLKTVIVTPDGYRAHFSGIDAFALEWRIGVEPFISFINGARCPDYKFKVDDQGISVERVVGENALPVGKFRSLRSFGCQNGLLGAVAKAFVPAINEEPPVEFKGYGFIVLGPTGTVFKHEHELDQVGYQSVNAGEVVPGMYGFRVTPATATSSASGFLINGERLYPRVLNRPETCTGQYEIQWVDRDSVQVSFRETGKLVPLLYVRGLTHLDCRGKSLIAFGAGNGFSGLDGLVTNLQGSAAQVAIPPQSDWSKALQKSPQAMVLLNGKELRLASVPPNKKTFSGVEGVQGAEGESFYKISLMGEKGYVVRITEEGLSSALEYGPNDAFLPIEGADFFASIRNQIAAEVK